MHQIKDNILMTLILEASFPVKNIRCGKDHTRRAQLSLTLILRYNFDILALLHLFAHVGFFKLMIFKIFSCVGNILSSFLINKRLQSKMW